MQKNKTRSKQDSLKMLSARVSGETVDQINALKDATKSTQAWIITVAVQMLYEKWIEGSLSKIVTEILENHDPNLKPGAVYTMELDQDGNISKIERLEAA